MGQAIFNLFRNQFGIKQIVYWSFLVFSSGGFYDGHVMLKRMNSDVLEPRYLFTFMPLLCYFSSIFHTFYMALKVLVRLSGM
jgi:hypothetical protein